jgi:hypothetical protein
MSKCKTYPLTKEGWNKAKLDNKKEKMDRIMDIGIYGTMGVLFVSGVIGANWLISYVACTGVSKSVKWMVVKGII